MAIVLIASGVILLGSFLFAMLGLGGSMVYVPVLHWLGFDLKTVAIPLGLLLNGMTTLFALVTFSRSRLVDWRGGWSMGLAAVLAAPLGAMIEPAAPHALLLGGFAVLVAAAALRMFWQVRQQEPAAHAMLPLPRRLLVGGLCGLGIGFIAGLLGVGGGFIAVPLFMAMGYPTKRAAGTTAMVASFSSFSGVVGHAARGHFPLLLTLLAVVAVCAGALSGARFMVARTKTGGIKLTYATLLLVIAVKLAWEAFHYHI